MSTPSPNKVVTLALTRARDNGDPITVRELAQVRAEEFLRGYRNLPSMVMEEVWANSSVVCSQRLHKQIKGNPIWVPIDYDLTRAKAYIYIHARQIAHPDVWYHTLDQITKAMRAGDRRFQKITSIIQNMVETGEPYTSPGDHLWNAL